VAVLSLQQPLVLQQLERLLQAQTTPALGWFVQ
jgi:hypothetical protein